jgi:hypothetical protein
MKNSPRHSMLRRAQRFLGQTASPVTSAQKAPGSRTNCFNAYHGSTVPPIGPFAFYAKRSFSFRFTPALSCRSTWLYEIRVDQPCLTGWLSMEFLEEEANQTANR